MKKNTGSTDKVIRVLIATVAITLYLTNVVTGTVGIILMALAGVFLLTSLISFCPIYAVFGARTCATRAKPTLGAGGALVLTALLLSSSCELIY